jgi:hypothetical protein
MWPYISVRSSIGSVHEKHLATSEAVFLIIH